MVATCKQLVCTSAWAQGPYVHVQKTTYFAYVLTVCVHYRCVSLNNNVTDLPISCVRYYSPGNGYFDGNEIIGLQMALSRISYAFHNESDDLNLCIELMEQYLCYYYFPLCNLTTGETTLVCSSSSALLVNNEDCSELRTIANRELEQDDIVPPDDVCIQTYSTDINTSVISGNCLSIEGM